MGPNAAQQHFADLPISPVLLVAPAGCGKTEALAQRVRAAVSRGDIRPPRKALAITYSNKARQNLAARMRSSLGMDWHRHVTVTNFHGLAARVTRAHGSALGLPPDINMPEATRLNRIRRELGITYRNADPFDEALAHAKGGAYDDDEVMARLVATGHQAAVAYEQRLRGERRIDYDDLIRHGSRLLALPRIAQLYRAHFPLVLVDEVQDLSLMQFAMATALGPERVTFAGDPAQGIYSWAGADPTGVLARIHDHGPELVEFNESYRSGPAVLRAVNALAGAMGSTQLVCGIPGSWSDEGRVVGLEHENTQEEGDALIALVRSILGSDPSATIGVVARRGSRADHLRDSATAAEIAFEDWSLPTHVPAVVEILRAAYPKARRSAGSDAERLEALDRLSRDIVDAADADTLDELAGALEYLEDQLDRGASLAEAMTACRVSPSPDAPVAPGLHLLSAHKGKGQEFDWVVILGMEDGHVPDFRSADGDELEEELRVLHVMASRARYGLAFTYSRQTWTRSGWRRVEPSRWLPLLRSAITEST